jgi:hypothetical protein
VRPDPRAHPASLSPRTSPSIAGLPLCTAPSYDPVNAYRKVAYQVTSTAEAPTPPNEATFTSVTVSYTAGFVPGEDLLIFIQSDISHTPVAYPGVNATASLENIVSDTGSMTFTGLAPAAVWEAILGRISYANAWVYVNYTLTAGVRNFSVCATDTAGNTGCSDAPALALYPGPPPYGIGGSDAGVGGSDGNSTTALPGGSDAATSGATAPSNVGWAPVTLAALGGALYGAALPR